MQKFTEIANYSFTYSGRTVSALTSVNLDISKGEIVILTGPTGCGKSTLLRSIIGLIPHMYSGERYGSVFVDGLDVSKTAISELAKRIGLVFQNPENQIFMFSVERDVAFALENLGLERNEIRQRVDWALNELGISNLAHRAPHELSDGQKQRVAIAGVLALRPSMLILDEPTSLLDPKTTLDLVGLLKKINETLQLTIVVVEHRLDLLATVATRVVVMDSGRIVLDGDPRRVLSSEEAFAVGVGVPTITRLHSLLTQSGIELGEPSLSAQELATALNVKFDDRV